MKLLEQKVLHLTYNGFRCYLEGKSLTKAGLEPGQQFKTLVQQDAHVIEFIADDTGSNTVSSKKRTSKKGTRILPVIDKSGREIRETLENCDFIKVAFYEGRVVITGQKNTAAVLQGEKESPHKLTCITFCAGSGITSECNREVGFKEVAACEYNPKVGAEDRFADIYSTNHPESIMFNIPMEKLSAADLPCVDAWIASLDCTDFSILVNKKKEEADNFHTLHLFTHIMRLFWQKPKEERPKAILIENVEGFKAVAGNSIKLCLEEEGYHVGMAKLNSLDYGSRTERERFFLVGTIFEGFEFPEYTGRLNTPISDDGVITLESLTWVTPEEHATLKYFLDREKGAMKHNHHMTCFDITTDTHIGTITKSHHKVLPYNWIKHPTDGSYAQLRDEQHLKYLHGIRPGYYLGESYVSVVQCVGQGVCCHTYRALIKKLHDFLKINIEQGTNILNKITAESWQPSLFAVI